MRRAAMTLAGAAAALGAHAAPAGAVEVAVTMPGKYFAPASVELVAGDSVRWTNRDFVPHDVGGPDGLFDSGRLGRLESFSYEFETPGAYRVICTLHTFMSQSVTVRGALLQGPAGAVFPGEHATLTGRVRAGTREVDLQRKASSGTWEPAVSITPERDGSFTARVAWSETAAYRAVAGSRASPPVLVRVSDELRASAQVRRARRFTHVAARTTPARPGTVAVLETYSRERFAWRRTGTARLNERGSAAFRVPAKLVRVARVRILREAKGPELARTRRFALRKGARGPAKIIPPGESLAPAPEGGAHAGH